MLRLESINDFEWRRIVERLDKGLAEAARRYLAQLHARHVSIRTKRWAEDLDELRLLREPDYDEPGLPLVYALKFMPRRVVSIVGSLLMLGLERPPSRVLDVGSGTGATALALDLLDFPRHIHVTGIEPSAEMRAFASSRFSGRVSAKYIEGSVINRSLANVGADGYDLVVFSATFPYHFDDWDPLLDTLGSFAGNEHLLLLAIEPDAKAPILDSLARRLRSRGWPTIRSTSRALPEILCSEIPLKASRDIWERIGSPGSTPPRTWWSPPDDRYLIANPQPFWPSFGEGLGAPSRRVKHLQLASNR